ncbi:MAG: VCBS repeat-containing protein [Cyclobacteriaceae bacterium]|nr:VCBS repeat-containing protein [Cyclobacteriaceae bacterium]
MKKILLLLLPLLLAHQLTAQWVKIDGPEGGFTSSFASTSNGIYGVVNSKLFSSVNDGQWWTQVSTTFYNTKCVLAVGSDLFIGTDGGGVFKSQDNGNSWQAANNGISTASFLSIHSLASDGNRLIASTAYDGSFFSDDRGDSWNVLSPDLSACVFHIVGQTILAGQYGNQGGMFKSTDGGLTWVQANNGIGIPHAIFLPGVTSITAIENDIFIGMENYGGSIYVSYDFGENWSIAGTGQHHENFTRALVSNGNTLLAATDRGAYVSMDGGLTWSARNLGITNTSLWAASMHNGQLYVGSIGGISTSLDQGETWLEVNSGINEQQFSGLASLGSEVFVSSERGIHKTSDNGATWQPAMAGLTAFQVRGIVAHQDILFATAAGNSYGLFRSNDAGQNWTEILNPTDGSKYYGSDIVSDGTTLALIPDFGSPFISTDNGITWVRMPFLFQQIFGTAFDGTTLYVATNNGLYSCGVQGTSWSLLTGLPAERMSHVAVHESTIYAITGQGSFFKSFDHGTTWSRDENKVAIDPINFMKPVGGRLLLGGYSASYQPPFLGNPWTKIAPFGANGIHTEGDYVFASSFTGIWRGRLDEVIPRLRPVVSNISPKIGESGSELTLTGNNFDSNQSGNTVFLGPVKATVTQSTTTEVKVTVPAGAAFNQVVVLSNQRVGFSQEFFSPTFQGQSGFTNSSLDVAKNIATGNLPKHFAFGDLDNDGKPDLVVANTNDSKISIFRNLSTPGSLELSSFASPVTYNCATGPSYVAIADLNNDGKLDIAVVSEAANFTNIFRNLTNGPGGFTAGSFAYSTIFSSRVQSIKLVDTDGDGLIDINGSVSAFSSVYVWRNSSSVAGPISFIGAHSMSIFAGPHEALLTDLTNDGRPEMLVTTPADGSMRILESYCIAQDYPTFSQPIVFPSGPQAKSLVAADFDGDGKIDIAVANSGSNTISVFRNTISNGTINVGSFAAPITLATNGSPNQLAVGDINGDGKTDLLVVNEASSNFSVFRNTATPGSITTGSFAAKVDFATSASPTAISLTDIDGNGVMDVAVANSESNTISLFKNLIVNTAPLSIASIQPSQGTVGSQVVITGLGFSEVPLANQVKFNGISAQVLSSNATSITVEVPALATNGLISVTTGGNTAVSPAPFCVTPAPPISLVGGSRCGSGSVLLSAGGGTAGQYRWYTIETGGTAIAGVTNATYETPALTATAIFFVAINNGLCESARAPVIATINPIPTAPTTTSSARCGSGPVTLTATGGTAGQYRWYTVETGGTAIAGITNATYETPALTATTIFYVAINNGLCESERAPVTATLNPIPPQPNAEIPAAVCPGATVTLVATGGSNGDYRWYEGGNLIVGATGANYTIANITTNRTLEVSVLLLCESAKKSVTATVVDCTLPAPQYPTVIASSGDYFTSAQGSLAWTLGEVMTETYSAGSRVALTQGFHQPLAYLITDLDAEALPDAVYPNPVRDVLKIKIMEAGSYRLNVTNQQGQSIYQMDTKFEAGEVHEIPFSELPAALYVLKLSNTGTQQTELFKIIKQ